MVRRTLSQLVAFVILSLAVPAVAQDVNWTVQLTAAGSSQCEPLTSETVNGQPFDLSKGAGMSMEICPSYYVNSSQNGYIFIQVPPTQPWAPDGSWYQWLPSPYTTPSQITRGTPKQVSGIYYQEVDTFNYTVNFTFYQVWVQPWNGTLIRNMTLHEQCGRWPCRVIVPPSQCTGTCRVYFVDYSATAVLTGTFPVPTPPASRTATYQVPATVSSLYRCGSDRMECLIADGGGPHCPRDLPNCKP